MEKNFSCLGAPRKGLKSAVFMFYTLMHNYVIPNKLLLALGITLKRFWVLQ